MAAPQDWSKLYDGFFDHPKVLAAGGDAALLYLAGQAYCSRHLTDGRIPKAMVDRMTDRRRPSALAARLVEVRLWHDRGAHYEQHDYMTMQATREAREERLTYDRRRQALHRDTPLRDAVRKRDGSACRYCGRTVVWTDRRSDLGGTYDHVDPNGENELRNLVVACRGCNSSKGGRTPEQAGMDLLRSRSGVGLEQVGSNSGVTQEVEVEVDQDLKPLSTAVDERDPGPPPDDGFDVFWERWPRRNGKRIGKDKAQRSWARLSLPDRRAAYVGAGHYAAASDAGLAGAKDAFRWLQGREWDDWQTPAQPDAQRNGHVEPGQEPWRHRPPAEPGWVQPEHLRGLVQ